MRTCSALLFALLTVLKAQNAYAMSSQDVSQLAIFAVNFGRLVGCGLPLEPVKGELEAWSARHETDRQNPMPVDFLVGSSMRAEQKSGGFTPAKCASAQQYFASPDYKNAVQH